MKKTKILQLLKDFFLPFKLNDLFSILVASIVVMSWNSNLSIKIEGPINIFVIKVISLALIYWTLVRVVDYFLDKWIDNIEDEEEGK